MLLVPAIIIVVVMVANIVPHHQAIFQHNLRTNQVLCWLPCHWWVLTSVHKIEGMLFCNLTLSLGRKAIHREVLLTKVASLAQFVPPKLVGISYMPCDDLTQIAFMRYMIWNAKSAKSPLPSFKCDNRVCGSYNRLVRFWIDFSIDY